MKIIMNSSSLILLLLQLLSVATASLIDGVASSSSSSDASSGTTTVSTDADTNQGPLLARSDRPSSNLRASSSSVFGGDDVRRLDLTPPDTSIVDANGVDIAATTEDNGTLSIVDTSEKEQEADQVLDEVKDNNQAEGTQSRRRLLSYQPSKWEAGWAASIDALVNQKLICETLLQGKHQQTWLHNFLASMCPARAAPPNDHWCYFHDHNHFVWYNSKNIESFELFIDKTPLQLDGIDTPVPSAVDTLAMGDDWEEIASKFTFLDETTGKEYHEYIEPLVSQLQFPLAGCLNRKPLLVDFASFILPPPSLERVDGRVIMYDMGSSDWSRMEYIVEEWEAHSAGFTYLITYAPSEHENLDGFLESVPEKHRAHIYRHYKDLTAASPKNDKEFFLPSKIATQARLDDYIMVKLDRKMNARVKKSIVDYILTNQIHVDELFWEINPSDNYVLQDWYDKNLQFDELSSMSLPEAYAMLTELRNRGIRAHSWI